MLKTLTEEKIAELYVEASMETSRRDIYRSIYVYYIDTFAHTHLEEILTCVHIHTLVL